jgi:hypothetical protein
MSEASFADIWSRNWDERWTLPNPRRDEQHWQQQVEAIGRDLWTWDLPRARFMNQLVPLRSSTMPEFAAAAGEQALSEQRQVAALGAARADRSGD